MSLLLQIQTVPDSLTNPEITEKTLSVVDLITSGGIGGNLVMGALGILSIFAIYILIERFSAINKASKEDQNFLKSIRNFVEAKDIEAAKKEGKQHSIEDKLRLITMVQKIQRLSNEAHTTLNNLENDILSFIE